MSTDNMEILFRGFHPCEDGDTTIYVEGKAVKGRWVKGGYWLNDTVTRQTPHIIDDDGNSFNVIPATVCQYTGLTDKNSKRIFEGDVVYIEDWETTTSVYWRYGAWFLKFDDCDEYLYDTGGTCEVIGTIFDAPEVGE